MKIHTFEIKFNGKFPTDMLRYDKCWPATEADAYAIVSAVNTYRTVKLCGILPPNGSRWLSFGCRLLHTNYNSAA